MRLAVAVAFMRRLGGGGVGRWVNGQHLRLLPEEQLTALIGSQWVQAGLTKRADGMFVEVRGQSAKNEEEGELVTGV